MPRGLQIAAAWSWRVILVVVLLWGIVWLVRYLSEVFIPVAVAILLTALMLPVANALKRGRWGLPRAAATAITVIGAVAAIVGALIVIGGQIAGQGAELSTNVVNGFNQLSDWLNNGPLTEWLRNGPLHLNAAWLDSSTWVTRITDFLKESGSASRPMRPNSVPKSDTSLLVSPLLSSRFSISSTTAAASSPSC